MTPKIFIHDSYKKKDGTAAIYVLVHLAGKSLKFPTGVSCDPELFDHKKQRIKGASQSVKDNNLIIEKSLATINDIAVRYRRITSYNVCYTKLLRPFFRPPG